MSVSFRVGREWGDPLSTVMKGANALAKNVATIVKELAKPIADELGLILWDVRFQKEGANRILRVFIDKDGGVSIDDCVNMSHALDTPLDELDPIDVSYSLQVSSPGIERELITEEHFKWAEGKPVLLRLIRPCDGERDFRGTLSGFSDGKVTLLLDGETEMSADMKEISFVKADDFGF